MLGYIARRVLLIIPTLLGIMLVNFIIVQAAPGGPVEVVIAQIRGQNVDATARVSGSAAGETAGGGAPARNTGGGETSKYRGARGLDPDLIKQLEKQFGFDQPAYKRFI